MTEPTCYKFENGLRLVHLHKATDVGHLGFFFRAGSRFEKKNKVGLAHFLEHCVFKGTQKRNAIQTISRIDEVGGELNAYTAKEELCLHASFPKEYTSRAIELLADIAVNPVFPKEELLKEKEIILDEINSYLDSPYEKIFDDFGSTFGVKGLGLFNSKRANYLPLMWDHYNHRQQPFRFASEFDKQVAGPSGKFQFNRRGVFADINAGLVKNYKIRAGMDDPSELVSILKSLGTNVSVSVAHTLVQAIDEIPNARGLFLLNEEQFLDAMLSGSLQKELEKIKKYGETMRQFTGDKNN